MTIQRGDDGFYHPGNENEIIELIKHAAAHGLKVRTRGSAHSPRPSIYTDKSAGGIDLMLDKMTRVTFDDATKQVTAEAGCCLGFNPLDPTRQSTLQNSLFYQVDQHGWAFPSTGGITHQTVGGFLSTGSQGGSLHASVGRQIEAIRMVDGTGNIHEFRQSDDPNNPFYGAGVSMGLMGVVTSVTFQCVDRIYARGVETTSREKDCKIDLFGTGQGGKPDLESFFRTADHAAILWFPQRGVGKFIVREIERISPVPQDFKPKRYNMFPTVFGSELPSQFVASLLWMFFDTLNPPGPRTPLRKLFKPLIQLSYPVAVNYFMASQVLGPQKFQEIWYEGLPLDNRANYRLLPTEFSELFFPINKTRELMNELRAYFDEGGFNATGTYAWELYCAPGNNFWMSPAYQRDSVRLDPFWFSRNRGKPARDFYPRLWEHFKKLEYRVHWGKWVPDDVTYVRAQYPRWNDFMALRAQLDPHQIFVNDYWRKYLDIPQPAMTEAMSGTGSDKPAETESA